MFNFPQRGGQQTRPSALRITLLVLAIGLAVLCEILLFSGRKSAETALSGELLQGGAPAGGPGFSGFLFSHFGKVTWLLPFVIPYVMWTVSKARLRLREIDYFRLGLRLLGFNMLLVGLCQLFSSIFPAGVTGAGGVLGDFLNILCYRSLPPLAARLIPLGLTLCGLMMFFAHSPWWFCDHTGSLIMKLWPFGSDEPEVQEQPESAKAPESAEKKQFLARIVPAHIKDKTADPRKVRVEPTMGGATSSGPARAPEPQSAAAQTQAAQPYAAQLQPFAAGPARSGQDGSIRTQERRIEPEFGAVAPGGEVPRGYADTPPAEDPYAQAAQDRGPATIVRDSRRAAPSPELERAVAPEAASEPDDGALRTIITRLDARPQPEKPEPPKEPEGPSSIITRTRQPQKAPEPESGPEYQAGAPGVVSDTVGNPAGRGGVSTVITRGSGVTTMQFGQGVSGSYSQGEAFEAAGRGEGEGASIPPALMEEASAPQSEGIFSFQEDDLPPDTYTQEPQSAAPAPQPQNAGALRHEAAPISEKDRSFASSFTGATRGLNGAPVTPAPQESRPEERQSEPEIQPVGAAEEAAAFAAAEADPENRAEDGGFDLGEPGADQDVPAVQDEGAAADEEQGEAVPAAELRPQEPPHADIRKFPARSYKNPMDTVPGNSDPGDSWRPPFDLLTVPEQHAALDPEAINRISSNINQFMHDFNISAKVAGCRQGPVVSLYLLDLAPGVKINQITSMDKDLNRYLLMGQGSTVRVIESIPETRYAGLEVPNPKRQIIRLREVAESDTFLSTRATLPLALGVNALGEPVVVDLAEAPHLLIAGTTGSGKSQGISSMLLSLLLSRSPSELRLLLVDPKQVEFQIYEGLPHLIAPPISDPDMTRAALEWTVNEMERRYLVISKLRKRSLGEYNEYVRNEIAAGRVPYDPTWTADMGGEPVVLKTLPYIVVVIDEFADLMTAFKGGRNKGEGFDLLVQRLAAKARAAGIHLLLATQTPRKDVVTGVLKANLPSRVCYTVQSAIDSRVVLDESGAEQLLGWGDMLALIQHYNKNALFRAHGPLTENRDVENVVDAWKEHCGEPQYIEGVTSVRDDDDEEGGPNAAFEKLDDLYDEALALVRAYQEEKGRDPSITHLQVTMGIGYPRAKRILESMKARGDLDP